MHPISDQDSTDFDKALRNISAPLVIAVGVTGGRLDHELAAMHTLVARAKQKCIVLGAESVAFVSPSDITLKLPEGSVFSLFPMGRVGARSEGLRWPTAGLAFAPDIAIGTSNAVTGPVRLWVDRPKMLVVLPRKALGVAVKALLVVSLVCGRGMMGQDGRADPLVAS